MVNPKRRKSKDNPYTIVFNNVRNIYIVSFKDGTNKLNEVEVSKEVFDVFNDFELNDISTMHKDRKHIDFRSYDDSEVIENYLFNNSRKNYKYLEDSYIEELEHQELRDAINELPEIQKRRLIKYYFYDKNFEEIGNEADRLVTNEIKELTDTKGEYYTSLRNLANGKLNMFDEKSSELYTLTND